MVLALSALHLAFRRPRRGADPATFFYGKRFREECEQDPVFGYELMKRTTAVVIERLQATRKQLLKVERQLSVRKDAA